MPIATKMPTQRSMRRAIHVARHASAKHEDGQHEIEREDRERRRRPRCASWRVDTPSAVGLRVVAFEHRDQADRDAEHDALDDAVDDVRPEIDRRPACCPRTRRCRRRSAARRRGSAPKTPIAENSAASSGIEITPPQKRGATTRASGSTAIISIADSCSVAFIRPISAVIALPGAAREQQPRHHRPELAHQRQRDEHAERLVGAVALQRVVALQRQHHADEQPGHQDDDERQHAGEIDLAQRQVQAPERRAASAQTTATKKRAA